MAEDRGPEDEGTRQFIYEGPPLHCSFCGRAQQQVAKLIAGNGVYICDECIALCFSILQEEMDPSGTFRLAVRRADGSTEKVEIERVPFQAGLRSALQRCHHCGTWLAGEGISACLHCGGAAGSRGAVDARPLTPTGRARTRPPRRRPGRAPRAWRRGAAGGS